MKKSKKTGFAYLWRLDEYYKKCISSLPCCGCYTDWVDVCAHHRTGAGLAVKAPDWETLPLCNDCHKDIHVTKKLGLYERQDELVMKARKTLVERGLIKEGEYPKEKNYI